MIKEEEAMAGRKGFIKGVLIGGIVGSITALLFAPKSGKENREDIKRRARTMKHDVDAMLEQMQTELMGRIDELKDVARELGGEAKQESSELIKRAEVLKADLSSSASSLTKGSSSVRDEAVTNAKRLLDEGSGVMSELERVTRKMMASAKDKMKRETGGDEV